MMRRVLLLMTAMLTALLLAGCDGGETDDAGEAEAADDTAITVVMDDMFFDPDTVEVPAGEPVTFELVNEGNSEHDLVLEGDGESDMVAPGETVTFEAGPFDADTVGWCSVPGHREAGMELQVVVDG